jgi:hypothetical protein
MKIIENLSAHEYHAVSALSSSGLKHLAKSPAHYQSWLKNPPEPTKAMLIGTAVHSAFLEKGLETGAILKAPGSTRATTIYKDFAKANPNGILLLEDEFDQVRTMVDTLNSHPVVKKLFAKGRAEVSAFWQCEETKTDGKARADFLADELGLIIDLKTTEDASWGGFQRSIADFKYHWQSAWYLDGISQASGVKFENFVHVAIEKSDPFAIGVYVLDDASLNKAREDIKRLKEKYAECRYLNEWPGIPAEIQDISIPTYEYLKEVS